jgi:hypothetical protein
MKGSDPLTVVQNIIKVHGGVDTWKGLEAIEANISVWGLLFTMKQRPGLNRIRVRASTREPRFTFFNFPKNGQNSVLIGSGEVCIKDDSGNILARREHPRLAFKGMKHLFYWDDLDFTYFGGYATWNYLVTPFLFLRDGFTFETAEPLPGMPSSWTRLQVTFPNDIPAHCRKQVYYFDEHLLLRRHDYTAEVVGGWAHAAHLCKGYRDFEGFKVPTSRRVLPLLFGNKPLPGPTLVAIEIHDILPIYIQAKSAL